VFVYAAGGYYYPGKGVEQLSAEMRSYLHPAAGRSAPADHGAQDPPAATTRLCTRYSRPQPP